MAATGQAYLCPDHGLIQRVEIPFGADDPTKICAIEDCDAIVRGPFDVTVSKPGDDELRSAAQAVLDAAPAWGRTVETSGAMQRLRRVLR